MEYLKKHYEKIILTVVLLGLAAASGYIVFEVGKVQQFLAENEQKIIKTTPKPLKPVALASNEALLQRLSNPTTLTFKDHLVFNPVVWQKMPDGQLRKIMPGAPGGPGALVALRINPLYLSIAYEGTNASGETLRYQFGVTREAEKSPAKRRKTPYYTKVGEKNDMFALKEIKGPAEDPNEFTLELKEGGVLVKVTKEKGFQRVAGYTVDLSYPPEKKTFNGKRQEEKIQFAGEEYIIVAITEHEVVLSSKSTTKRTTIKYNAVP